MGATLALALARPWRLSLPGRALIRASWAVGLLLVAYGMANLVQHALLAMEAVETPEGLGSRSGTPSGSSAGRSSWLLRGAPGGAPAESGAAEATPAATALERTLLRLRVGEMPERGDLK